MNSIWIFAGNSWTRSVCIREVLAWNFGWGISYPEWAFSVLPSRRRNNISIMPQSLPYEPLVIHHSSINLSFQTIRSTYWRITFTIYRKQMYLQRKLSRKMKRAFYAQYTFPLSLVVSEIIKQNRATTLQMLRCAYISSIGSSVGKVTCYQHCTSSGYARLIIRPFKDGVACACSIADWDGKTIWRVCNYLEAGSCDVLQRYPGNCLKIPRKIYEKSRKRCYSGRNSNSVPSAL
jgi:hypothetical protein